MRRTYCLMLSPAALTILAVFTIFYMRRTNILKGAY